MILGDNDIKYYMEKKKLVIEPIKEKTIQQNGADLSIGDEIAIEKTELFVSNEMVIDSHSKRDVENRFVIKKAKTFKDGKYFIIEPKSLNLLVTQERVEMPDDLMAICSLRSSVARSGFIAPVTIVDAGFRGTLTIEVFYAGNRPFKLYVGDRFLHLIICKTNSPVRKLYSGVYQDQTGVKIPKTLD